MVCKVQQRLILPHGSGKVAKMREIDNAQGNPVYGTLLQRGFDYKRICISSLFNLTFSRTDYMFTI